MVSLVKSDGCKVELSLDGSQDYQGIRDYDL